MNIKEELARLERMTTGELAQRCVELCDEPIRTRNRAYLTRKIAWRLQALAEGDLSERARRRAAELADIAEARLMPPKDAPPAGRVRRGVRRVSLRYLDAPGASAAQGRQARPPD